MPENKPQPPPAGPRAKLRVFHSDGRVLGTQGVVSPEEPPPDRFSNAEVLELDQVPGELFGNQHGPFVCWTVEGGELRCDPSAHREKENEERARAASLKELELITLESFRALPLEERLDFLFQSLQATRKR